MPTQQGSTKPKPKKPAAKTAATRNAAKADAKALALEKEKFRREATAVFEIFFALFLLISLGSVFFGWGDNFLGSLSTFTNNVLLGLFGHGGVLIPLLLLYLGILNAFGSKTTKLSFKKAAIWAFVINTSLFLHIFSKGTAANFKDLYTSHLNSISGGIVGGLLHNMFDPVLNAWAIGLLCAAVYLICLVPLLNFTLEKAFRKMFPDRETRQMREEAMLAAREETRKARELAMETERLKYTEKGVRKEEQVLRSEAAKLRRKGSFDLSIDEAPAAVPKPAKPVTPAQEPISEVPENFQAKKAELPKVPFFHFSDKSKDTAPVSPTMAEPVPLSLSDKLTEHLEPIEITKQELVHEIHKVDSAASEEIQIYKFPPTALLTRDPHKSNASTQEEVQQNSQKIISTLKSFGVEATLLNVAQGPTVTRYELAPAAGVKISKITNLSDDLALSLAAVGVRIEAPIPGKAAIGIEVPNKNTSMVYLRSLVECPEFKSAKSSLTFALGTDIGGSSIVGDIAKMPHVLIAGSTGSGKSVCINSLVISLIYKSSPADVRLIMVDPKVVELGCYNGIPHLLIPVVTDPKKAAGALAWAVGEMMKRYQMFAEKSVKDITGYNLLAPGDDEVTPLPRIVIIIDELADLMMVAPGEVEDSIMRLAQMARAAGMHLVIATQRPTVNVITGTIKANVPSRIAFAVSSQIDSRTILDASGAEKLVGKGDMLYYPIGAVKPMRLQGCFVTDKEVEAIVSHIKANADEPEYDNGVLEQIERESEKSASKNGASSSDMAGDEDEMLPSAIDCVIEGGSASTSMLQRRLKLGYARAARLVDEMEERGIVGPPDGSKPRQVLISKLEWQEMKMRRME